SILEILNISYGSLPQYSADTPLQQSDAQFDYVFSNFEPNIVLVTSSATYTASYTSILRSYTIEFLNYDNTVLQSSLFDYGVIPSYEGVNPTKESTVSNCFIFDSFEPLIEEVTEDKTYTASFLTFDRSYLIVFQNYDGEVLQSSLVAYGEAAEYLGSAPTKESTLEYSYVFASWSPSLTNVTEDTVYTAVFSEVLIMFNVVFKDYNGDILKTQYVPYNEAASAPTPPNNKYNYYFTSWSTSFSNIISDVEVYAIYDYVFSYNIVSFCVEIYDYHDNLASSLYVPFEIEDLPVTKILGTTFENSPSVTSLFIPSGVTFIEKGSFNGLSNLASISLPFVGQSVTPNVYSFFGYIFGDSTYDTIDTLVPASIRNVVITSGDTLSSNAFYNCTNIQTILLSPDTLSIGNNAFYNCSSLLSIMLPNNLESLGAYAFAQCSSLVNLYIPLTLTTIGYAALEGCDSLELLTIPFVGDALVNPTATNIGYIFGTVNYLNNLTKLPLSLKTINISVVTTIYEYSFYGCENLTNVNFLSEITVINRYAFYNCSSLESLVFPSSLINIKEYAFYNNTSLVSVTFFDVLESIGSHAFFNNTSIKELTFTGVLDIIGDYAFSNNTSLEKIVFASTTLQVLGEGAFSNCSNVVELNIVSPLRIISDYAFYDLNKVTVLNLPASLTHIGSYAFHNFNLVTNLVIPSSVVFIGIAAFSQWNSLEEITLPFIGLEKDYNELSDFGNIFSELYPNNLAVPVSLRTINITSSSPIFGFALADLFYVETININESVTYIGVGAFMFSLFSSIVLPPNITNISAGMFAFNTNLSNVDVPYGVNLIDSGAFEGCVSLEYLIIPSTVLDIYANSFTNVENLNIFTSFASRPDGWLFNNDFNIYYEGEWFLNNGVPVIYT
ncbi:MAG: leucine-rich repeat domain-containing protein, partial [Acholeplasmatales bacterium]|nr:leucine-rich repeat domain-containing protein [Acholeplasmatales bacterium]